MRTYSIFNLGMTYFGAGRYSDAERVYRRLLEIAPDFLWTRAYFGKTLLAEGKPEAALAIVQQDEDTAD